MGAAGFDGENGSAGYLCGFDREGIPGELAAEIKILITATDGVSRAWFTVQDGRRGYLTIAPDETAGWGYIIGGVGEQALFEGIRYAG